MATIPKMVIIPSMETSRSNKVYAWTILNNMVAANVWILLSWSETMMAGPNVFVDALNAHTPTSYRIPVINAATMAVMYVLALMSASNVNPD